MNNKNTLSIFLLFVNLFVAPKLIYANAEMPKEKDSTQTISLLEQNTDAIYKSILGFLTTYSLKPYITGDNWSFKAIGIEPVINDDKEVVSGVIHGEVFKDKDRYKIAFLISQNRKTNEIQKATFLYMGNTTISLQLLFDMLPLAFTKAKLDPNGTANLFIKDESDKSKDYLEEEWIFFNEKILNKLKVILKPDGKGGTDFEIK